MSKTKNIDIKKFHILYDNVFVRGIDIEEKDGIIKPAQYEDKPEIGEVISVGEGRIFDNGTIVPLKVQPGDIVYFNKYSTTKFNFDGSDWYAVREEDILGYIRK
mgnify:CR=1 FL=1